tara:strand:+ start:130 stop:498 length:369 start_codon:yes stop_codon:yes gene_type:complete
MNCICIAQSNVNINYINHHIENLITISKIKYPEQKISIYSIQIKASERPENILKVKKNYLLKFPSENIDELFEAPYFKLIIGYYLDKKQAEKKLKEIKKTFTSAFILKREISIEKFKKSRMN